MRSQGDPGPNQQLLVPTASKGTWYVLAYGETVFTPGEFTISVQAQEVILTDIAPRTHAMDAPITLTLTGAGFDRSTRVQLKGQSGTYPANEVEWDSATRITAKFAENTVPEGVYSVEVSKPQGSSSVLPGVLTLIRGKVARLETKLILPDAFGVGAPATIYVEYTNAGTIAMPAPVLMVQAINERQEEGAWLTLQSHRLVNGFWTSASPEGFSHSPQILASGKTPGVLQPGEAGRVPIYYVGWKRPWGFRESIWRVSPLTADLDFPINWNALKEPMRPPAMNPEAWDHLWPDFTAGIGVRWGDYVRMLGENADYLGRIDRRVDDVNELLAFELQQAEGLNPFGTLASAVDAQVRAPGMPISFSRSFAGNISGRFELGALGRGWAHNWQYSLEQAADGKVTVRGPHSSRRVFQPDSRRAGSFFSTPSDTGTLTNRNGAMEIYEASGVFTAFRPDGRLDYVQDPNGNRITANYTGSLLTSLTHSSGQQLELAYNAVGRVDRLTAYLAPGVAVYTNRLDYDSAGQHLTRAVYYDGRIASYGYELNSASPALHSLTNVTSACCDHRYFTYDSLGRLQSTSLTDGAERLTLSYGRAGQVTVTDALNNSTITLFDHRGRVARVENALGNTVQFTHDINGRLTKLNDPAGLPHQYGYGRSGNLERLVDPLGYTTRLGFGGPFNKMTELTDANSNPTRYRYDEKGNLRAIVYADDSVEGWTYDGYGNATTWTNRRGQTIQYRYDARGALTNKIHLDGRQEVYLHDHRGNLTNAASLDPAGLSLYTLKYAYNGADQLTNIAYPGGQWLAFTYTEAGRRATSLDQTGHLLAYSYDGAGRLEAMTNQLSEEVVRYTYDATGRMRHKQVGKTVSTTYDYDSAGQLLSLTNRNFSGTVLSFFNYAYDDRGRRYSMDTHFGKWTYRYDDLGQLTNAALFSTDPRVPRQNITYGYDALGNRLWTLENGIQRDYQPNRLNQYERVGHIQIYFDADGNTTNEVGGVDTVSYIMSDENRLLRVLRGRSVWDYTYDALGARVSTEENGTVTRYLVDPIGLGNLVGEYDGNGNILAAYDFGVGLLQKVQAERKGAIVYAFDAMGNAYDEVLGLASIRRQYAYEPFGPMDSSDAVDESRLSLGAEYGVIRGGSGLYFMRARCYVKELGRFITSDPIGARGGINLYGYAVNNPLSFIDPSGLSGEWHDDTSRPPNPNPRTPSGKHPFGEFLKMEQIFDDYNASRNTHLEKVSWEDWNNGVITEPGAVVKPWPKEFIPVSPEDFFGRKSLIPPDKALIPFPIPPRWCELHPVECKEYCTQCGCCDGQPRPMRGGFDPNAKSGPGGYGAAGHIAPGGIMPYRIDFENDKNATAPAQQVVITDKLSSSLDWTMFQLTEVGFGDLFIAIPSVSYFETNVVMNYLGMDFAVQIETGIRLQTGEVYAVFRSLNPDTGLPPPVDVGFLPPEDGTRRGMGHVSYTIRAKPNLPTGTEIRNIAMISFDNQEVIATNQRDPHDPSQGTDPAKEALNTIDVDVPSSAVLPLPTTAANHRFTVTWAGADRGAGVASYDIYASADNGPWSLWLSATTNSSGAFPGLPLTRYGFFSVARDGVGHTEPPRWAADTTTTTLGSYPPVIDPVPDLTIEVGQLLVVTNFAHDVDTNLVFTLGPGAPRGATLTPIGPETALFRWQPGCLQGNTTNRITVQVTDNGVVPESSSITFTVRVNECVKPDLGALVLREGQTGVLPLNLTATTNYARLLLGLPLPADRLAVSALEITNIAMICSNLLREAQGGYILELFACTNQWLYTSNRVERQGWLYLKATPGQSSAVVPLEFGPILGTMPGGAETSIDTLSVGRVVIVGEQPLLEAVWREGAVFLVLYAPPGTATRLESATALGDAADWQALQVVQPSSELQQTLGPIQATDSVRYFRARRE
jgi:RHS repeat-associated protein